MSGVGPDEAGSPTVPDSRPIAVFDIDGVLADVRHRLHHLQCRPQRWEAFFTAADRDPLLEADGLDGTALWWALSLGACLGGNGTLIGASANVVLSDISKKFGHEITFMQFFKRGFPIMLFTVAIAAIYMVIRFPGG